MLEFRILGPLEVQRDGRPIKLGAAKQRALLAILLLHANRVVSRDRLIDGLWGEQPPPTASTALRVYVSELRKALAPPGSRAIRPSRFSAPSPATGSTSGPISSISPASSV